MNQKKYLVLGCLWSGLLLPWGVWLLSRIPNGRLSSIQNIDIFLMAMLFIALAIMLWSLITEVNFKEKEKLGRKKEGNSLTSFLGRVAVWFSVGCATYLFFSGPLVFVPLLPSLGVLGAMVYDLVRVQNDEIFTQKETYLLVQFFHLIASGIMWCVMSYPLISLKFDPIRLMVFIMAITSIFSANYAAKIRRNSFIGISSPWAFESEEVWNRAQRLMSWMQVAVGILIMIALLLGASYWVILAGFLPPIAAWVYSWRLYNQLHGSIRNSPTPRQQKKLEELLGSQPHNGDSGTAPS